MSNKEVPSKGNASLSNLEGIGSKRQVVDLEEEITEEYCWVLMGRKESRYVSGLVIISNAAVLTDNFDVSDDWRSWMQYL